MGVLPDSAIGLIGEEDLRAAEARRTDKPFVNQECEECGKIVGNDYHKYEVPDSDYGFYVCGECNCDVEEGWDELQQARANNEI